MKSLDRAYEIGKAAGLRHVYLGNVGQRNNTHCPRCNSLVIARQGYSIQEYKIKEGLCLHCGDPIDGVGL